MENDYQPYTTIHIYIHASDTYIWKFSGASGAAQARLPGLTQAIVPGRAGPYESLIIGSKDRSIICRHRLHAHHWDGPRGLARPSTH